MDDFEQPETSKLGDEEVLLPNDAAPMEEMLSRIKQATPQVLTPEPLSKQEKSTKTVGLIILVVVLMFALVGGVMWSCAGE